MRGDDAGAPSVVSQMVYRAPHSIASVVISCAKLRRQIDDVILKLAYVDLSLSLHLSIVEMCDAGPHSVRPSIQVSLSRA